MHRRRAPSSQRRERVAVEPRGKAHDQADHALLDVLLFAQHGAPRLTQDLGVGTGCALQFANIDPLYDEAVAFVLESRRASISSVQRKLRIGYNRAARIIDDLESEGIIGPADGARPREILV